MTNRPPEERPTVLKNDIPEATKRIEDAKRKRALEEKYKRKKNQDKLVYWEEKKKEKREMDKKKYEKEVDKDRAKTWISLITLFYHGKRLEENLNVKRKILHKKRMGIYIWRRWKKLS